jgi:hypothetical protein
LKKPKSEGPSAQPESAGGEAPGKEIAGKPNASWSALYRAAVALLSEFKRAHRAYYRENPQAFRATVRRAENRVLRLKPGPKRKYDPRIGKAARARARGASWTDLYPVYIDHYREMTEYTRSYAEEGFRKKVNEYLRRHPKRKSQKVTPPTNASGETKP